MMRWLVYVAALLLVLLLAAAVAAYFASPWLAERWLISSLEDLGFTDVAIKFDYPGPARLRIESFEGTTDDYRIEAQGLTLEYAWQGLMLGRLASARVDQIDAELTLANSDDGETTLPAPIDLWDLIPIDRLEVSHAHISIPGPDLGGDIEIDGTLSMDPAAVSVALTVFADLLGEPVAVEGSQSRDGTVRVRLNQTDAAVIDVQIVAASAGRLAVEGTAHLEQTPFTTMVERLGGAAENGRLKTKFAASLPWPLTRLPTLQEIHASGTAAGDYGAEIGTVDVAASLSADFAYDGKLLSLTPTPDSQIRVSADAVEAIIEPTQIDSTWDGGESLATALSGRVHAKRSVGDWSSIVTTTKPLLTRVDLNSLDLDAQQIAVDIDARLGELHQKTAFTGRASLKGDIVSLVATLDLEQGFTVPLNVSHDLDTETGEARIDQTFDISEPLLAALLPGWTEDYDLDRGKLALRLKANWAPDVEPTLVGRLRLSDGLLNYDNAYYLFDGVAADLDVHATPDEISLRPSKVTVAGVDVGFPVTNLRANVAFTGNTLRATDVHGSLLGGEFSVERIDYDTKSFSTVFTAMVNGVDLARVLALEGEDLQGQGTLDGKLPITVTDNIVSMTGGSFEARPPGGSFRYASAASIADAAGQPGVDFALRALDDFRYEHLSVGADYTADGTLTLNVRLEGHNPQVESGRGIHYNVTVTENIPTLLTSLRLADGVTEGIQKRLTN